MAVFEITMGVPRAAALRGAAIDLHDTHATLDESAREQAFAAGILRIGVVETIETFCFVTFAGNIHCFRHASLHSKSQIVSSHASVQRGIVLAAAQVPGIETLQKLDAPLLGCEWKIFWRFEVEDG